jgi:hypothetical protein
MGRGAKGQIRGPYKSEEKKRSVRLSCRITTACREQMKIINNLNMVSFGKNKEWKRHVELSDADIIESAVSAYHKLMLKKPL